jgi:hypothetical protein
VGRQSRCEQWRFLIRRQVRQILIDRLWVGDADAIAARGFGSVKSHISVVQEFLDITAGEVAGESETQGDTDGELRGDQLDRPGRNGLAEISAQATALAGSHLFSTTRNSSPP